MTVVRFNPFREMMTLREAMDRLFEESVVRPRTTWRRGTPEEPLRLPVDVYTTPEEIVLTASLPGLLPEEVDITIEGDTLTIRGELRPPLDNVEYLFQERAYGHFSRSLTLNVPVDVEKAEAVFENGVLTLTLPKVEEIRPKTIRVKTK
ncbi:MAG TPA: Hsp20/alpha crystallin family protein [Anaerolineales bacterium]|nr:Hsp20/alpha crystallin family protein [Anaerolineae bacterium]HIQ01294.1 Hsp20/alpha crystallin family protein [Anaerolineales bacterium]